jgi:cathepsin L
LREHSLTYSGAEYHLRFGLFLANSRFVREHNSANKGFTLSLNQFAVYTPSEYRAILGSRPVTREFATLHLKVSAPDSWDWRDRGAVVPIKDQGQCGSVGAFSAIGAQESQWFITTGDLESLSEQNLMDCAEGGSACDGSWLTPEVAYDYVIKSQNGYFTTEALYPYGGGGTCKFTPAMGVSRVTGYNSIQSGNEASLLDAVYNNGPASTFIDASHSSFQLYSSGVYNEPACSSSNLDHVGVVVGYGVSGAAPYWIFRNSWGTSWGIQGYIWMSRNKNNQCGIATNAIIPTDK